MADNKRQAHKNVVRMVLKVEPEEDLGDHPKPASRDHPKTGQLQTSNQDKIVVPYLESSSKFFPILFESRFQPFWFASFSGHTSRRVHDGGGDRGWRRPQPCRLTAFPSLRPDDWTSTGYWHVRNVA